MVLQAISEQVLHNRPLCQILSCRLFVVPSEKALVIGMHPPSVRPMCRRTNITSRASNCHGHIQQFDALDTNQSLNRPTADAAPACRFCTYKQVRHPKLCPPPTIRSRCRHLNLLTAHLPPTVASNRAGTTSSAIASSAAPTPRLRRSWVGRRVGCSKYLRNSRWESGQSSSGKLKSVCVSVCEAIVVGCQNSNSKQLFNRHKLMLHALRATTAAFELWLARSSQPTLNCSDDNRNKGNVMKQVEVMDLMVLVLLSRQQGCGLRLDSSPPTL